MEDHKSNATAGALQVPDYKTFSEKSKINDSDIYVGTTEKTQRESSYDYDSLMRPYNPDDIYQKAGDYSLYECMVKDEQVNICLQLKKDLVVGPGFDIVSEEEGTEEIAKELEALLKEDLYRPLEDQLEEILSAYEFGFSITEKVFRKRKDGSLALKCLKTRHPNTWLINSDKKGDVEYFEQQGIDGVIKIDPKMVIHYVNNGRFQNQYGISDLRPAYMSWYAKKEIVKFYNIFIEANAKPIPVGKYPVNIPDKARQDLFNSIKKFQQKTALLVPEGVELNFLEAKSTGEVFNKAIDMHNMFIGRSLFCPDLLGFQGGETKGGSFALGSTQMDIFFRHISRRRQTLERLVNSEIIKPLVIYNFGIMDSYPKFKLRAITEDDTMSYAQKWIDAVQANAYRPSNEEINHFRKIINFPQGEIEEVVSGENDPIEDVSAGVEIKDSGDEDKSGMVESEKGNDKSEKVEDVINSENFAAKVEEGRTDINKALTSMDTIINTIVRDSRPVISFIFNDLIEQISKKKILQGKPERINDLKLKKLRELNTILNSSMRLGYIDAKKTAQSELFKREFAEPLAAEAFLNFLDSENFDAIGKWAYGIDEQAKIALRKAIKDGENLPSVMKFLTKTEEDINGRIERYARTKATEVYNKGRIEFFESSTIVDGYIFRAIDDGRTTQICSGLNGKTFKKGTEPVPPLHFNALIEGSLIRTINGDISIDDIKIGDIVLSHKNRWCEVYDVMNKFEDKEYFEIELENNKKIDITGEHPILTKRGWIRADEIMLTDDIICFEDIEND